MRIAKILIANRGEIAVRIASAAADLGVASAAIYAEDDAASLHTTVADERLALKGQGAAAYLDAAQIVDLAKRAGCDAIHPGYGFLAESAAFAKLCREQGIVFIGPRPEVLALFASKDKARVLAAKSGVAVLPGSDKPVTLAQALAFFAALDQGAAMVIKAVAGGGGRGMRVVTRADEVQDAWSACRAEAKLAFGDEDVLVERFLPRARHIEVQIVADSKGDVVHLGERECSLQRRRQKLVELAPCPDLHPDLRGAITEAAVKLARAASYDNIGTFEFLVDAEAMRSAPATAPFWFLEANPRVQVEHTVTEAVTGVDLVQAQIRIARGETLAELGVSPAPAARGFALQMRVNAETLSPQGEALPAAGTIALYDMPVGNGVRVDGYGYAGYRLNPRYDSLLAKIIVSAPQSFADALTRARRALRMTRIAGVDANIEVLRALLDRPEMAALDVHTRFVDEHLADLAARAAALRQSAPAREGLGEAPTAQLSDAPLGPDQRAIVAPMQGLLVEVSVAVGDAVVKGQTLALMEAMKMVHPIVAPTSGVISGVGAAAGIVVTAQQRLFILEGAEADDHGDDVAADIGDLDEIRADLNAVLARRRMLEDEARPEAVAKRRKHGQRTARENIADLCDEGSFVEYGGLAIASQRKRRSVDDLIQNTPADGIVTGIGAVNGALFEEKAAQCAVLAYDYTVLAGTQGVLTHRKKDRLLELAERNRLPVVLFSEGGGGRPGDTDFPAVSGLDVVSFQYFAKLSGLVPLVGVNSGRCFAGNAALLGCCDVIIATENSSIGMGGPAMIEGGGLGVHHPDDVGPISVQAPNGVVDVVVRDETEAVAVAKTYLSYFQGRVARWTAPDQRRLRRLIPEDRVRVYDIRAVIATLADEHSVLELRKTFGHGIVTAFARIEGRPVGIIANNPMHLGGAIDGPAADKAARFMQLCDAHDIPMLSLCDTPGFMVGPESEKTAVVRRFARLFVTAAGMTIPFMTIVLRKAYGLGAMSMLAGQARVPDFLVSWPNGEFGGMGIEGAVKLGLRKELEAIADPDAREAYFKKQVAAVYEFGKALNAASHAEIDDVIDPSESRRWIVSALRAAPEPPPRTGKKRSHVDTW